MLTKTLQLIKLPGTCAYVVTFFFLKQNSLVDVDIWNSIGLRHDERIFLEKRWIFNVRIFRGNFGHWWNIFMSVSSVEIIVSYFFYWHS